MIPLTKPEINEEMKNAAIAAMENEHFVLGESVFKFEEEFARYIGTKYAISVNSGTSALMLAEAGLGIKAKEKVIVPTNSFIATANAVVMNNSIPVFAEIDSHDGAIDTSALKSMDTKGVRGIIPVHIYGNPCNMDELLEFAREKNIFVIEDACQAHGAEYGGKKAGALSDAGCFSFYSTKNMTVCGDGGMVTTNNEELKNTIVILRNCGRISQYEHPVLGYTMRLNTINAAIGRVQLKYLDEWNEKRIKIAEIYRKNLPSSMVLSETKNGKSVYHLFVIKCDNRDALAGYLKKEGVGTAVHYPIPMHKQQVYKELGYNISLPVSENFANKILSIPVFPSMKKDEALFVCEKINEFVGRKT